MAAYTPLKKEVGKNQRTRPVPPTVPMGGLRPKTSPQPADGRLKTEPQTKQVGGKSAFAAAMSVFSTSEKSPQPPTSTGSGANKPQSSMNPKGIVVSDADKKGLIKDMASIVNSAAAREVRLKKTLPEVNTSEDVLVWGKDPITNKLSKQDYDDIISYVRDMFCKCEDEFGKDVVKEPVEFFKAWLLGTVPNIKDLKAEDILPFTIGDIVNKFNEVMKDVAELTICEDDPEEGQIICFSFTDFSAVPAAAAASKRSQASTKQDLAGRGASSSSAVPAAAAASPSPVKVAPANQGKSTVPAVPATSHPQNLLAGSEASSSSGTSSKSSSSSSSTSSSSKGSAVAAASPSHVEVASANQGKSKVPAVPATSYPQNLLAGSEASSSSGTSSESGSSSTSSSSKGSAAVVANSSPVKVAAARRKVDKGSERTMAKAARKGTLLVDAEEEDAPPWRGESVFTVTTTGSNLGDEDRHCLLKRQRPLFIFPRKSTGMSDEEFLLFIKSSLSEKFLEESEEGEKTDSLTEEESTKVLNLLKRNLVSQLQRIFDLDYVAAFDEFYENILYENNPDMTIVELAKVMMDNLRGYLLKRFMNIEEVPFVGELKKILAEYGNEKKLTEILTKCSRMKLKKLRAGKIELKKQLLEIELQELLEEKSRTCDGYLLPLTEELEELRKKRDEAQKCFAEKLLELKDREDLIRCSDEELLEFEKKKEILDYIDEQIDMIKFIAGMHKSLLKGSRAAPPVLSRAASLVTQSDAVGSREASSSSDLGMEAAAVPLRRGSSSPVEPFDASSEEADLSSSVGPFDDLKVFLRALICNVSDENMGLQMIRVGIFGLPTDYANIIKMCIDLFESLDEGLTKDSLDAVKAVCKKYLTKHTKKSDLKRQNIQALSNKLDEIGAERVEDSPREDLYYMKSIRATFEVVLNYKRNADPRLRSLYSQGSSIYLTYIARENFNKVFTKDQFIDLYEALIDLYYSCDDYLKSGVSNQTISNLGRQVLFMLTNIEKVFKLGRDGKFAISHDGGIEYMTLMCLLSNYGQHEEDGEDQSVEIFDNYLFVKEGSKDSFEMIMSIFSEQNVLANFSKSKDREICAFGEFIVLIADRLHRLKSFEGDATYSDMYNIQLGQAQKEVKLRFGINRSVKEWSKFFHSHFRELIYILGPRALPIIKRFIDFMLQYDGNTVEYNARQGSDLLERSNSSLLSSSGISGEDEFNAFLFEPVGAVLERDKSSDSSEFSSSTTSKKDDDDDDDD